MTDRPGARSAPRSPRATGSVDPRTSPPWLQRRWPPDRSREPCCGARSARACSMSPRREVRPCRRELPQSASGRSGRLRPEVEAMVADSSPRPLRWFGPADHSLRVSVCSRVKLQRNVQRRAHGAAGQSHRSSFSLLHLSGPGKVPHNRDRREIRCERVPPRAQECQGRAPSLVPSARDRVQMTRL